MNPDRSDIVVELSMSSTSYSAKVHFNLLKSSQTVSMAGSIEDFIEQVAESIGSSSSQAVPFPGTSSASVAKFQPVDLKIFNSSETPLPNEQFEKVSEALRKIEEAWHDDLLRLDLLE